jgi:hypothetical protein
MAAFRSTVLDIILRRCTALSLVSSSFEWHYFVDRLALFHQQIRHHCDIVTVKRKMESTYCFFSEEHVDGSPEESCSLVPARVQQ